MLFRTVLGALSRAKRPDEQQPNASQPASTEASSAGVARTRAAALRDEGRYGASLAVLRSMRGPGGSGIEVDIARLLERWGRQREALEHAGRVDLEGCDAIEAADVAAMLLRGPDPARALEAVERARRIAPSDPHVMRVRAAALLAGGRISEAVAVYEAMAAADPGSVDAWMLLAEAKVRASDLAAARACIGRVLALDPAHSRAWEFLGALEGLEDHVDAAVDALARAEACDPDGTIGDAFVNQAICLCNGGRWAEAVDLLMRELPSRPSANGHMTLGPALLVHGRFEEGWRQYEFRWLSGALASGRPAYDKPAWDGQPLEGRTILIVAEQGIGDLLQFSRYFPLLRERGARVVVQIPASVGALAERLPGIDLALREGDTPPAVDYFSFLLSLPRAFATRLDTIPPCAMPLEPLPERRAKWRAKLGERDMPRVGIVWAGSPKHMRDRHRSLRLDMLEPVLSVPGARFYGLQKGPAVVQAQAVPESVRWESVGPEFDDLEDAAAAIAELDLLVTVDTGLAHLAGIMGKPVWMLNGNPPDFRWLLEGDDTVWYPTIRQFRQPAPGAWAEPVERLARELRTWVDAWNAARDPAARPAPPMAPRTERSVPPESRAQGLSRMAVTRSGYLQFDPDEPFVGVSIERLGEWLPARLDTVLALCRPGATIVAVDAGDGAHAIPIARMLGPSGHLLAHESRPAARRRLAQNLAANGVANATILVRDLVDSPRPGKDTLDDLGLERVDGLVLSDAERGVRVIGGASGAIWGSRPWIVADAGNETVARALIDGLRAFGYRFWIQDTPCFRSGNFNRREQDPLHGRSARTLVALPEERPPEAAIAGHRELP